MRIISRYLLASYLGLFAAILCVSVFIVAIVDLLLHLDRVLDTHPGFAGFLSYVLLRVPARLLRDLIPVSAFAASFVACGLAARWHEIVAMKVGGISPRRVAIPILFGAALLSLFATVINETLVVGASREWRRQAEGDGGDITYRRGSFWYHRGRVIYNIREADRATHTLRGVSVFELSDQGRLERSIHAETVRVEDAKRWSLVNATIRRFDAAHPDAPPAVERVAESVLEIADERDLALLDANPSALSLRDLFEYVSSRAREGDDDTRFRALLHARLADPVTVVLFSLLAVPIGLRVEQTRSLAAPALHGVLILAAFYAVRNAGHTLAAGGAVPPTAMPWLVLSIFAGYGAWLFVRIPR